MWGFRRKAEQPDRTSERELTALMLRVLTTLLTRDNQMLELLKTMRADLDVVKANFDAGAAAEVAAATPLIQSMSADIAALKALVAPVAAAPAAA